MKARLHGCTLALALALIVAMSPTATLAEGSDWQVAGHALWGVRFLDKDEWAPIDRAKTFGVRFDWGKKDEPIRFATDAYYSRGDGSDGSLSSVLHYKEIAIGIRKTWAPNSLRPWLGAGVAVAAAGLTERRRGRDEYGYDRVPGMWLDMGLARRFGASFDLGIGLRYTAYRKFFILDSRREASGLVLGLVFGWGLPETKK